MDKTKPTVGTKLVERNGYHRRIVTRSYVIVLTEVGGSNVKAVRLDNQASWGEAKRTAEIDNPGWRFKGMFPLTDRDFKKGERV